MFQELIMQNAVFVIPSFKGNLRCLKIIVNLIYFLQFKECLTFGVLTSCFSLVSGELSKIGIQWFSTIMIVIPK